MAARALESTNRSATARNLHTRLLQAIAEVSQAEVALAAGIEKTAMHRVVKGDRGVLLDEFHDFLDALGMTLVERDGEMVTIPGAEYEALRTLARKGLEQ